MHSKFFLGLSLLFFTKKYALEEIHNICSVTSKTHNCLSITETRKRIIYQFVNKDNGQNPNIDAFSHTPLGILENHTLTMNSTKDTLSNRSSRTESKYRNQNNIPVG